MDQSTQENNTYKQRQNNVEIAYKYTPQINQASSHYFLVNKFKLLVAS